VLQSGETSLRALALTGDAITLNPANYTAWQHRRACVRALNADLRAELQYVERIAERSPKNYQVWQHRKVIVEWLGDGSGEPTFTTVHLCDDAKNYHAWSHRQWAVKTYGLWDGEMEFTEEMLMGAGLVPYGGLPADVRNNSAWSHRWFVLTRGGGTPQAVARADGAGQGPAGAGAGAGSSGTAAASSLRGRVPSPQDLEAEVRFTLSALKAVGKNESAWSHLRALVALSGRGKTAWRDATSASAAMREFAAPGTNIFANEWLAEVAEEGVAAALLGRGAGAGAGAGEGGVDAEGLRVAAEALATAVSLYEDSARDDAVRSKYWALRAAQAAARARELGLLLPLPA
jgi:hypothetical protein